VSSVAETLDSALIARLHAVLEHEPATEADLRRLFEEGEAWVRILRAQLHRTEERLERRSEAPGSTLMDIASDLRRTHELAGELDELSALLLRLRARARELRTTWLPVTGLADREAL
jgi:predicted phage gp36 major capsid-like protein